MPVAAVCCTQQSTLEHRAHGTPLFPQPGANSAGLYRLQMRHVPRRQGWHHVATCMLAFTAFGIQSKLKNSENCLAAVANHTRVRRLVYRIHKTAEPVTGTHALAEAMPAA